MFKFLRWLGLSRSVQVSEPFDQAAASYLNLVKSRIVGAVVVRDELLLPESTTSEQKYGLLTALCGYFVARTDMELEQRKVPERQRKCVWAAIPEAVLEEMNFAGTRYSMAERAILKQSEFFRGVMETHGPANAAVLAKTLLVMAPPVGALTRDSPSQEAALTSSLTLLLEKVARYDRYLDAIATHARSDA